VKKGKKIFHSKENLKEQKYPYLHQIKEMLSQKTQKETKKFKIINIHALNIRAPKYVKQIIIDLKGETDCNTKNSRGFQHTTINNRDDQNRKSPKKYQT
jgi:DNA relaxase NicK